MDKQRHKLLLYVNECAAVFSSEAEETLTSKVAVELLEKDCEDKFVNYGISGALKMYIVNCKTEEKLTAFVLVLVQKLKLKQPSWIKMRVLTCLSGVLSTKVIKKLVYKDRLVDLITKDWNSVVCSFLEPELRCHGNCDQSDLCMFELIRLWKKLVKQILKSDEKNKFDFLKNISQNNDKIWNLAIELQHALFRNNILKLFNRLLPYGELLSQCSSNMHALFTQTAESLFTFFYQNGFPRIHVGCDGGFTGRSTKVTSPDKAQIRLIILLTLKSTAIVTRKDASGESKIEDGMHCLCELDMFIRSTFRTIANKSLQDHDDWIMDMFEDQDDMWIESLLALLDIYNQVSQSGKQVYSPEQSWINPHRQFIIFLKATEFDDSVLIDLLTSPETCFLLYFTRYLKCMRKEWIMFTKTSKQITVNKNVKPGLKTDAVNDLGSKIVLSHTGNKEDCFEEKYPQVSSCGLTLLGLYESDEDNDDIISPDMPDNKNDNSYEIISPVIESTSNKNIEIISPDIKNTSNKGIEIISPDIKNTSSNKSIEIISPNIENSNNSSKIISPDRENTSDEIIFPVSLKENNQSEEIVSPEGKLIDEVISCIIRVRLKISKLWRSDLFPYNPNPLISNIEEVEDLYEKHSCM